MEVVQAAKGSPVRHDAVRCNARRSELGWFILPSTMPMGWHRMSLRTSGNEISPPPGEVVRRP